MKITKIAAFALTSALVLTSCADSETERISRLERIDVSDIMDTDIDCVSAEELFSVEEYRLPSEITDKFISPTAYFGDNFYFFYDGKVDIRNNKEVTVNSEISVYNIKTGEYEILLSETPVQEEIKYNFAMADEDHLWFFRVEAPISGTIGDFMYTFDDAANPSQLYRMSLSDKTVEQLPFEEYGFPYSVSPCYGGFSYCVRGEEYREYYFYDLTTGEVALLPVWAEARFPVVYKNGWIYMDGENRIDGDDFAFYYFDKNGRTELFLTPEERYSFVYSDGKNVFVTLHGDELSAVSEYPCTVYMLDGDMNRKDLAVFPNYCEYIYFSDSAAVMPAYTDSSFYDYTFIYDMKSSVFAYAGETRKQLTDGSTICTISDFGSYTLKIYSR